MKRILLIAILLFLSLNLLAQKIKISDFSVEIENAFVIVNFKLETIETIDLGLFCLVDSTPPWIFCKTIEGDIENQKSGYKTIFWNALNDSVPFEKLLYSDLLFLIKPVEPYAVQRAIEEKAIIKQKEKEKRAIAAQNRKEESKIANENLDGHYISLGSSFTTSGYYGGFAGFSYEYRYKFYGINASFGYGGLKENYWGLFSAFNANIGFKLYFAQKIKVIRNLYVNILPVCYLGQQEIHTITHYVGDNNNIIRIDDFKYPQRWGVGLFLGYSPIWHINKKIALGFNIDVGIRTNYKFSKPCPYNFDVGFISKF
jgi:hypothetical protein